MKIHNKLEIITNGNGVKRTRVFFNTLLDGVLGKIENFEAYNTYFAFGTGTIDTVSTQTKLQNFSFEVESSLDEYNFNPSAGDIFVTKIYNFGESLHDEITFSEVGIARINEDNPDIFNRFVTKNADGEVEPVVIGKNAEVIVKITLYLALDKENSNVHFFNCQSPLFARLLGVNILNASATPTLKASECYIDGGFMDTDAPAFNISKDLLDVTITPTISSNNLKLTLSLSIQNKVVRGLVFTFGGVSVFYINCYNLATIESKTIENVETDKDRSLMLADKNVKDVYKLVYHFGDTEEDDVESNIWYYTPYSKELGEVVESPFGEYDYTNADEFISNTEGSLFLFRVNGRLDVYYRTGAVFKKVDASNIPIVNIKEIRFVDEYIFIRYFNPETEKYSMLAFSLDVENLKMVDFGFKDSLFPTMEWVDWDISKCNGPSVGHGIIIQTAEKCFVYSMGFEDGAYKILVTWTFDYQFTNVKAEHRSEDADAMYYGFTTSDTGAKTTYYIRGKDNVEMKSNTKVIQYIFFTRTDDITYVNAKGYTLAVDNSCKYHNNIRLYLSSVSVPRNANYTAGAECTKAFFSEDGRYIAKIYGNDRIEFVFTMFDRMNQFNFVNSYKIPTGKTVKRVIIVGRVALILFNEANTKMIAIPFVCDYVYVENVANVKYTLYYNVAKLCGGENKTVNSAVDMVVSI